MANNHIVPITEPPAAAAAAPTTTTATTTTNSPSAVTKPGAPLYLFPPSLVPASVQAALPEGYKVRPLTLDDHGTGFLGVLAQLTQVGSVTAAEWAERFGWMRARGGDYCVVVVEDDHGRVVATGSLVVERKFIRGLGAVGHIEDIAVEGDQRGRRLGLRVIEALEGVARQVGCYKSILDCSEANEGFYLKCGFKRAGLQMAHYY